MSGGNINPGSVASGLPVHWPVDGVKHPTVKTVLPLCGSRDLSTPFAAQARYVSCPACLPLMTAEQQAERREQVRRYPSSGGGS